MSSLLRLARALPVVTLVLVLVVPPADAATEFRQLLGDTMPYTLVATVPDGWQVQQGGGQGDLAFQPVGSTTNDSEIYVEICGDVDTPPVAGDRTGAKAVQREIASRQARSKLEFTTKPLGSGVVELVYATTGPSFLVPVAGGHCIAVEPTVATAVDAARALATSARAFLGERDEPVAASNPAALTATLAALAKLRTPPVRLWWSAFQCEKADLVTGDDPFWAGRCPSVGTASFYHHGELRVAPGGRFYAQTRRTHANRKLFPDKLMEGVLIVGRSAWTRTTPTSCWKPTKLTKARARRAAFLQIASLTPSEYRLSVPALQPQSTGDRYAHWTSFATTNAWLLLDAEGRPKRLNRTTLTPPPYLPWSGLSELHVKVTDGSTKVAPPAKRRICR